MQLTTSLAAWLLLSGAGLAAFPQEKKPPVGDETGGTKAQDADPDAARSVWDYLAARYDTDGDGKISEKEYSRGKARFARLDRDGNGFIEKADTEQRIQRTRGSRERTEAPSEGAVAPNFKLETLQPRKVDPKKAKKGEGEPEEVFDVVELKSFKGKKPVALVFGSYT